MPQDQHAVESVNAGLKVTRYFEDGSNKTETIVESDFVNVTAQNGHIVPSNRMHELSQLMDEIAARNTEGDMYYWILYMIFDGRVWYMESSKGNETYDLGYLNINDLSYYDFDLIDKELQALAMN